MDRLRILNNQTYVDLSDIKVHELNNTYFEYGYQSPIHDGKYVKLEDREK